jgi:hypothetical protein
MMRFPLRLTAQFAKTRIARIWRTSPSNPLMKFVDSADVLHLGSAHPVSHEKMQGVIASHAPVVWIGGSEPLDHPGISHFVLANALSGHFVFLETNGVLLRRRIHEFQPLPRVFLTVRLGARRTPAFELAVEGIRAARLSGFFTVVHSLVSEDTDQAELKELSAFLSELQVDGWLITAATVSNDAVRAAREARSLISSWSWRSFSEQVERMLLSRPNVKEPHGDSLAEKPLSEISEESIKVA